jgi:hypothetical protein
MSKKDKGTLVYDIISVMAKIASIQEGLEEINKNKDVDPGIVINVTTSILGHRATIEELTEQLQIELSNYRQLVDTRYSFLLGQQLTLQG